MPPSRPIEDRLWDKVNKNGPIPSHRPELGNCWIWTGATTRLNGHGVIKVTKEFRVILTHRVAWELTFGKIPLTQRVLHKCDTPRCVNPRHLFLGTQNDNMVDMCRKGRHMGKLGWNQINAIRWLRDLGAPAKYLSKVFGLHFSTIYRISAGDSWKHDPEGA